ncbi:MAG: hypothetical protein KJO79_10720 [Verrucomicrobiae bacterium]|nr:hypothetical protein [Verrucomicrobiae bacterium]NNJ87647.1 hypothetical protein [Akkermansiaceae bacterium]
MIIKRIDRCDPSDIQEVLGINDYLKEHILTYPRDVAVAVSKKFYPLLFQVIKQLINTDQDLQRKVNNLPDFTLYFDIQDQKEICYSISSKDSSFDFSIDAILGECANLTVCELKLRTLLEILAGELDILDAYMDDKLKYTGNFMSNVRLLSLFELLDRKYRIKFFDFDF